MVANDATLVTGSPGNARPPRVGDVLAERYELVQLVGDEPLTMSFRALDQETDASVLVRTTAHGLLREKEARSAAERLCRLIGKGNPLLPAIRDVDREGSLVFSVEPWPAGTSLRAVLDARRGKGALSPREVLPVIARLSAAISSIPEPFHHGDVRAERVWIDRERLVLAGAHLVAALPGVIVAEALSEDEPTRRTYAPEVSEGLGGRPADRWGVAAIAWEALTGRPPAPGPAPAALGVLGPVLQRYLNVDPSARPPTLDPLVSACAELAGLPVPQVDAKRLSVQMEAATDDEATQNVVLLDVPTDPNAMAEFSLASATMELPFELPGADDTAPHRAIVDGISDIPPSDSGGRLDARLVSAALADAGQDDEEGRDDRAEGLDPRLVRAALGVSMDASGEHATATIPAPAPRSAAITQELQASDLEILPSAAKQVAKEALAKQSAARRPSSIPAPSFAARSAARSVPSAPPRVSAPPVRPNAPPAPASPPAAAAPGVPAGRRRPVKPREPVPVPEDIKPIPRPRMRESGEMQGGPVLFDASRPAAPRVTPAPSLGSGAPMPSGPPVMPMMSAGPAVMPAPAPAPFPTHAPTTDPPPPPFGNQETRVSRPNSRPSGAPAWLSWVVLTAALLVAVIIVGSGFWYRAQQREETERRQRIEERLRALSSEGTDTSVSQ